MNISKTFQRFCHKIHLYSTNDFDTSIKEITKKLNRTYYDSDSDSEHIHIVGSIGRGTAVNGVSDVDIIFDLPPNVYSKFDAYSTNGQSALLQEIKEVILERYPNTAMRGDGQVVVIEFNKYTIELVPGFLQSDRSFKYPDTEDGGSWKKTDPFPEQEASREKSKETDDNFTHMCNMLRAWKNNIGLVFGGLLIDTLVFNFFDKYPSYISADFSKYYDFLKDMFYFLSKENPDQQYWFALGSNQHVDNTGHGAFVRKAKKAYSKLNEATSDEQIESGLEDLLGHSFSDSIKNSTEHLVAFSDRGVVSSHVHNAPNEQFIEDIFPVDIRYSLVIDCKVTQKGFRPFLLSSMLPHKWLSKNKSLVFSIASTTVQGQYDIYWKVRNRGIEAIKRNDERGEIILGKNEHRENTLFNGNHYVECYLVQNGVCIARAHIDVPINISYDDSEHRI